MKKWKKILTGAGLGIMLLTSSVYGAEGGSEWMQFYDNELSDGSLIYYFEEVALTLPADWKGKTDIEINGNSATFYHKASREKWLAENGTDGGKLFTLSCSVNHDFSELPDFSYIGFSEESVMNYFLIFPTDVQAYVEDSAVATEFQQLYSEIDFVKNNARMLGSETQESTSQASLPVPGSVNERVVGKVGEVGSIVGTDTEKNDGKEVYYFDESQAGYEGTWVKIDGGFEVYLPSSWNVLELTQEDREEGFDYLAASEDEETVYAILSMSFGEDFTKEEIEAELNENNMTMRDVIIEQLDAQGYTYEKEADINDISCVFYTESEIYGSVFMSQDGMTMETMIFMGDHIKENPIAETILHSVRWA